MEGDQGRSEIARVEFGPHPLGEVQLGIGTFPEQEVRQPLLTRGADDEIDIAQTGLARDELCRLLEGSRNLDAKSTQELLARLEAEGLIRGDTEVDLTVEGKAMHQSLREYIAGPTIRLLGQFDIQDIETTVRTMQAITRLAEEESSSPAT